MRWRRRVDARDDAGFVEMGIGVAAVLVLGGIGILGVRALIKDTLEVNAVQPGVRDVRAKYSPGPPGNIDKDCLKEALALQGLAYTGNGWVVEGVDERVLPQRSVDAIIAARIADARAAWEKCKKGPSPGALPEISSEPSREPSEEEFFYGRYEITIQGNACQEFPQFTTMQLTKPGDSNRGFVVTMEPWGVSKFGGASSHSFFADVEMIKAAEHYGYAQVEGQVTREGTARVITGGKIFYHDTTINKDCEQQFTAKWGG